MFWDWHALQWGNTIYNWICRFLFDWTGYDQRISNSRAGGGGSINIYYTSDPNGYRKFYLSLYSQIFNFWILIYIYYLWILIPFGFIFYIQNHQMQLFLIHSCICLPLKCSCTHRPTALINSTQSAKLKNPRLHIKYLREASSDIQQSKSLRHLWIAWLHTILKVAN